VDTRLEYQRVLFQQFKRSHEFSVKVVSQTEFVLSLALPANDLVAQEPHAEAVGDRRLMTVVSGIGGSPRALRGSDVRAGAAGTRALRGSDTIGSPKSLFHWEFAQGSGAWIPNEGNPTLPT
jgi:hypothetical protein